MAGGEGRRDGGGVIGQAGDVVARCDGWTSCNFVELAPCSNAGAGCCVDNPVFNGGKAMARATPGGTRLIPRQMTGREMSVQRLVGVLVSTLRVGLSIAVLSGVAWAEDRGTPEERRACTPDVLKHCNEFIPNADRIEACLQAKLRQLSPACRVVMIGEKKR
jgi:hypothetical protein